MRPLPIIERQRFNRSSSENDKPVRRLKIAVGFPEADGSEIPADGCILREAGHWAVHTKRPNRARKHYLSETARYTLCDCHGKAHNIRSILCQPVKLRNLIFGEIIQKTLQSAHPNVFPF
jgi:hypothetical protein